VECDELRDDQRCPKCGSVPSTYEADGEQFCWPHRERMASSYSVSACFLTTVYAWRGHSHRFPNAKLFEAGSRSGVFGESPYCESCQRLYDEFLAVWRAEQRHAEPGAAADGGGV
jgi:hypothetical protein